MGTIYSELPKLRSFCIGKNIVLVADSVNVK